MKILDLDMDYFMEEIATGIAESREERLLEDEYGGCVWSEKRIKKFLEDNLGLSKERKIKGRIVMTFIINNFGATVSLGSIAEHFEHCENIKIRTETLNNYLKILENAKIIYQCPRFDVKSKKSLRDEQKYYLADLGIYFSRNVDARINYGPVLENIVYTYLSAKNYKINVGRIGKLECDFITRLGDEYRYVQVAMTIMSEETEEREYKPFTMIRDNYPKYIFTIDTLLQKRDGVIHKNIINFISENENL